MRVFFLESPGVRLVKTFTPTEKRPYPHAYYFTSFEETITNIKDLYNAIKHHAERGRCLLKGTLRKKLTNESRAGSTSSSDPTWYIVFDVDRTTHVTPEAYIQHCLPPCFHDVSYIWQWSNSAGITKHNACGHIVFLLDAPIDPKILKQYITALNFWSEDATSQIRLSSNGQTLSMGLDPTTAQNDKLIYIGPPNLIDIKDPITERITLIEKSEEHVHLDLSTLDHRALETEIAKKLNALRAAAGLPKRTAKYITKNGTHYLANPERAIFRGPYIEARGFRYGNLNNGDSYAYFHPLDNPTYLFNFKGEPPVRLEDIDPEYWTDVHKVDNTPNQGHRYSVFRDQISDTFYTVDHDLIENKVAYYAVSSQQKANEFLSLHRKPIPSETPLWTVSFDPTNPLTIDYEKQWLNLFQPTEYLKRAKPSQECPPDFARLLLHVVGDDMKFVHNFTNWLALIVQRRTKTGTAVVLHGRTGTGKGVLTGIILPRLLGEQYVKIIDMAALDERFNGWQRDALMVVVDEARINDHQKRGKSRLNRIKHLITEPRTLVEMKGKDAQVLESHLNMIFTSNEYDSIMIQPDDRRFKVPPRQEHPIDYTEEDIEKFKSPAMIQAITDYLTGIQVDERLARTTETTAAKRALIEASKDNIDQFVSIIKSGNLDELAIYSDEPETHKNAIFRARFHELLAEWFRSLGHRVFVSNSDMRSIYNFLFNSDISPTAFGKLLANRNVMTICKRTGTTIQRGLHVVWTSSQPIEDATAVIEHFDIPSKSIN